MNRVTQFFLKHRWFTALFAFVALVFPFTNWMSMIAVALVTLRKGPRSGFWIVAVSSLAVVLLGTAIPKLGWGVLVVNVLFGTVLIWVLASLLRATESWSQVITLTMMIGLITIAAAHIHDPNIIAHQKMLANYHLNHFIAQANNAKMSPEIKAAFDATMKMVVGLFVFMVLGSVLMSLMAARALQAKAFQPGGLRQELHAIRINLLDLTALTLIGFMAYLHHSYAIDMLPLLLLPFLFAGSAFVHRYVDGKKHNKLLLVAYYVLLGTLLVQMIMFTTVLAIVDYVRQIRGKYDGSHLIRKNP